MEFQETQIYSKIDPYFQRLLERRQRGLTNPYTSSTSVGEVATIARVKDVAVWLQMSEVREGTTAGQTPNGSWIVTGRIPVARIEAIRQADNVLSLKPARRLRPLLDATVQETRTRVDLLPPEASGQQGANVVVGIVDFGCDFQHDNFRRADGTTRILSIWDQTGESSQTSPFGYGKIYTREDINRALQESDPYAALGYAPPKDSFFQQGTHGTHVMDIATGNGRGTGLPGVAPEAEIVFVEVAATDIPWTGEEAVGKDFGDSVQLLEAIKFIFELAGERPCVVNLSLGTNGGPHDGSSLVEQGIDALVSERSDRAVIIAASNSFADGIHAEGTVPQDDHTDILWKVSPFDFTDNELEIWYSKNDEFRLELIAPGDEKLGSVGLGQNGRLQSATGQTLLFVSHRAEDPNNGDNAIGIFLEDQLPAGTWILRLHGVKISDGKFHAWIERDDPSQSSFAEPYDNSHTLGSISTGHQSIVVGSYDAHKTDLPLSWFSSAGPTRDGRKKPEVSAPGHAVFAAHSRTGDGVVRKSGTSMASPAVAGLIALMLAEAQSRHINLSIDTIRQVLQESTQVDPPTGNGWHDRYGHGRVDGHAAVSAVMELAARTR